MYENFEKLPFEKRKRIIDVCIEEFGDKGYTNASTNTIVKNAGISKGTLFNYFDNKKNLFLFILDYTTDYYVDFMIREMKVNSSDFFKRVLDWAELKIKVSLNEPLIYRFFITAYTNIPDELNQDISERYKKLSEKGLFLALDGIDYSKFRDDIDKQKTIELLLIILTNLPKEDINKLGLSDDKGLNTINERFEKLKEYVDILCKVFYK
ncbi:MAG: TetR/AcrR family transcriptional regulator [Bacillota bacterium]|nr:TetR/AcrR family transcriptional regulator [Bacillota bacterium]